MLVWRQRTLRVASRAAAAEHTATALAATLARRNSPHRVLDAFEESDADNGRNLRDAHGAYGGDGVGARDVAGCARDHTFACLLDEFEAADSEPARVLMHAAGRGAEPSRFAQTGLDTRPPPTPGSFSDTRAPFDNSATSLSADSSFSQLRSCAASGNRDEAALGVCQMTAQAAAPSYVLYHSTFVSGIAGLIYESGRLDI
eukprot:6192254-Pleurochrysis_carterae.AAC.1